MKRKNLILATVYVILGWIIPCASVFGMYMLYFRGDILVGINATHLNWWIRKVLYALLFCTMAGGLSLMEYGLTYFVSRRKKR